MVIQSAAMGTGKDVESQKVPDSDFLTVQLPDQKEFEEWMKLIFKPVELSKKIADYYKIPLQKFFDFLGDGFATGIEPLIAPAVTSFKIVEKIFAPNSCCLGLICQIGGSLNIFRRSMLKIKPSLYESSSYITAMAEGIGGGDCEKLYSMSNCELKLVLPLGDSSKSAPK